MSKRRLARIALASAAGSTALISMGLANAALQLAATLNDEYDSTWDHVWVRSRTQFGGNCYEDNQLLALQSATHGCLMPAKTVLDFGQARDGFIVQFNKAVLPESFNAALPQAVAITAPSFTEEQVAAANEAGVALLVYRVEPLTAHVTLQIELRVDLEPEQ